MVIADWLVPLLLSALATVGVLRKRDVYGLLIDGAEEGLRTVARIAPTLVILMTLVAALRGSGALDLLSRWLAPLLRLLGIPPECAILMLVRPFSGSAALAVGAELIRTHGVDSLIGRTAAVMLGSTETTFYALSVYFGAAGVKQTRYTIPAALIADWVGYCMAAISVRAFYGMGLYI